LATDTENDAAESSTAGRAVGKVSRKFTLAVCMLLILAMCVFWLISSYNTRNLLQRQADALGEALAEQTATQLTELVLANDLISMNVVLTSLSQASGIEEISVYSVDNSVIATASSRGESLSPLIPLPVPLTAISALYEAPIALPDSVAGYVRLQLNLDYIEVGTVNSMLLVIGATALLLIVAILISNTYFQYLVSFPTNLLSFALSNIRKGDIETCPEPESNNELSAAIRQYNATAEFLAQNAFLDNFGNRQPDTDIQNLKFVPGKQDITLLVVSMANYQYLASTLRSETLVKLLNKFYFFIDKVTQLYNGSVTYCAEGEVVIHFSEVTVEEDQAFYGICAAQLFLHIVGDINDVDDEIAHSKYKLAVHSGQMVSSLYSPITQTTNNLSGETLDQARAICQECPDNFLLISEQSFEHAGSHNRLVADEFAEVGEADLIRTFLGREPMSNYKLLIERQAIQLVTLYSD
jgi:uncharacterized membrane protein affecting hemolysin expression/class 3 adenylate cyclase